MIALNLNLAFWSFLAVYGILDLIDGARRQDGKATQRGFFLLMVGGILAGFSGLMMYDIVTWESVFDKPEEIQLEQDEEVEMESEQARMPMFRSAEASPMVYGTFTVGGRRLKPRVTFSWGSPFGGRDHTYQMPVPGQTDPWWSVRPNKDGHTINDNRDWSHNLRRFQDTWEEPEPINSSMRRLCWGSHHPWL